MQDWPSERLAATSPGVGQAEMKKDFQKKKASRCLERHQSFQKKKASRCLERHQSRQQSRKMQLLYVRNDQDSTC